MALTQSSLPAVFAAEDILTPEMLAARLSVRQGWVYNQLRPHARKLPNPLPFIRLGGLLRFHWPTVSTWLQSHSSQPIRAGRGRKPGKAGRK